MNRKLQIIATVVLFVVMAAVGSPQAGNSTPPSSDSAKSMEPTTAKGQLVVTYFHGNARCATCRKLEGYAVEVMDSTFGASLKDSSIVWRLVNYDETENEHYLKDYSLFTKSLILSFMVDGKEKAWKNLDKIWELVGDKEEYQAYVRNEINTFLAEQSK